MELADEVGDRQGYDDRQEEVLKFWSETEEKYIKPILDTLDDPIKDLVQKALYYYGAGASDAAQSVSESVVEAMTVPQSTNSTHDVQSTTLKDSKNEDIGPVNVDSAIDLPSLATDANGISASEPQTDDRLQENMVDSSFAPEKDASTLEAPDLQPNDPPGERSTASLPVPNLTLEEKKSLEAAIKQLRLAYNTAKRASCCPTRSHPAHPRHVPRYPQLPQLHSRQDLPRPLRQTHHKVFQAQSRASHHQRHRMVIPENTRTELHDASDPQDGRHDRLSDTLRLPYQPYS